MVAPAVELTPAQYVVTWKDAPVFDEIDGKTDAMRRVMELTSRNTGGLEEVTIGQMADGVEQRVALWEAELRERLGDGADGIIEAAEKYLELPSRIFRITRPDFLALAVLLAATGESGSEMLVQLGQAETNLFDQQRYPNGVELLELGRIENIRQQAMMNGVVPEVVEEVGSAIVAVVGQLVAEK